MEASNQVELPPEFEKEIKEFLPLFHEKTEKYQYAFMSVILASFVLSVNFSSNIKLNQTGINNFKWLLIVSWILYFISALIGGIRITKDIQRDILHKFYIDVYTKLVVVDKKTGEEKLDQLPDKIKKKLKKMVGEKDSHFVEIYSESKKSLFWQFWIFLFAIFFNGVFVVLNFL